MVQKKSTSKQKSTIKKSKQHLSIKKRKELEELVERETAEMQERLEEPIKYISPQELELEKPKIILSETQKKAILKEGAKNITNLIASSEQLQELATIFHNIKELEIADQIIAIASNQILQGRKLTNIFNKLKVQLQ